ncbi:MAG: histidine--tRNA ligase [Bacteroidales bacterium]|jgi:histidyl-tRNA synthetase|nr:histidine--tRNA ligase [Bacteroidales bacterium]
MNKEKISVPRGTRDFLPHEMMRRNYIFGVIRDTFENYGYLPIETPAMENLSLLLGKYGEEGDRLLFKILNSGNFMSGVDTLNLTASQLALAVCEKGLRYDLTVPFARFVVQHRQELTFPFKRYQIQPVWRADRPQKGRYREFYQCDADVIGSNSLLNEAELVMMTDTVFSRLKMDVRIKINNRKILAGIAQLIGCEDKLTDITLALDKIDKIGLDKVNEELLSKDIPATAIDTLQPVLLLQGTNEEKIKQLKTILQHSPTGLKGIEETETLFGFFATKDLAPLARMELDVTLARGLNYYTGLIFEVESLQTAMGSIAGGGRYDNLTAVFGLPDMSGVGISFGIERIYDIWSKLNEDNTHAINQKLLALFINFGQEEVLYCLKALKRLREANISAELFPEEAKLQKQMKYANDKQIPYVILAGENEIKQQQYTVKNMRTGLQKTVSFDELITIITEK